MQAATTTDLKSTATRDFWAIEKASERTQLSMVGRKGATASTNNGEGVASIPAGIMASSEESNAAGERGSGENSCTDTEISTKESSSQGSKGVATATTTSKVNNLEVI
jgi:hypothetical protein